MTLHHRIRVEERSLAVSQADWDRQAEPLIERLDKALDDYAATGFEWYAKEARCLRLDLSNLGPRPIEGLTLAQLRSRLARQERGW